VKNGSEDHNATKRMNTCTKFKIANMKNRWAASAIKVYERKGGNGDEAGLGKTGKKGALGGGGGD